MPAQQSTCCAFAGPGLSRLYVTTATEFWTEEQRAADPAAGLVYRFDTQATGLPAAAVPALEPVVDRADRLTDRRVVGRGVLLAAGPRRR